MNKAVLNIQNLRCSGCKKTINANLNKIVGITNLEVDLLKEQVKFLYNGVSTLNSVIDRLLKLGYPRKEKENSMKSKIKSLSSCAIGKIRK